MKLSKLSKMVPPMSTDAMFDAPMMSAARAIKYARRIVEIESRAPNDAEAAMERIERKYGIGFWPLSHLRKGNAKTCDVSLYARLRLAYLDMCGRMVASLENEIAIEKAASGDDTLEALEAEARALAQKIAAKRTALGR